MLVDDDVDDNFFHERVIRKNYPAILVIAKQTAEEALDYLKSKKDHSDIHPDLIFLDINMPAMNGWEFLEEYNKLDKQFQSHAVVVMLTTSGNPDDMVKAQLNNDVADYKTKPLTKEMLEEVIDKYFS
jgi:response regulator of citrate/malate metabolism